MLFFVQDGSEASVLEGSYCPVSSSHIKEKETFLTTAVPAFQNGLNLLGAVFCLEILFRASRVALPPASRAHPEESAARGGKAAPRPRG